MGFQSTTFLNIINHYLSPNHYKYFINFIYFQHHHYHLQHLNIIIHLKNNNHLDYLDPPYSYFPLIINLILIFLIYLAIIFKKSNHHYII
jgi:hypothetical protein